MDYLPTPQQSSAVQPAAACLSCCFDDDAADDDAVYGHNLGSLFEGQHCTERQEKEGADCTRNIGMFYTIATPTD